MNGNELSPPSTDIHVYITSRPRLALIERKLMKPILRRNKFVQPPVSIGYTGIYAVLRPSPPSPQPPPPHPSLKYMLTRKNVSRACKVPYRVTAL